MTEFNKPALILGTGVTGENIAFLAEPKERYKKNEIFSYFSEDCTKLTVIPFAEDFATTADRNFVINTVLDSIENDNQSEYLMDSYEIDKLLH